MNFVKDIKKIDNTKIYFMIMLGEKKFTVLFLFYIVNIQNIFTGALYKNKLYNNKIIIKYNLYVV